MCPKSLIHILAVQQIDGEFKTLCDQRREEEEAEGNNLEYQKLFGDGDVGIAGGSVLEAALAGGGERKSDEDGDCEERIDVYESIQCRYVNARC